MSGSAPGRDPRRGRVRVLVCEDEALSALRLQCVLQAEGYEVLGPARDGEEGVRIAREQRPDIILMDISMPRMDGIRATGQIMRDCPTPIVILSAYSDEPAISRALDAGALGYLVKPVLNEQLTPALRMAAARFEAESRCTRTRAGQGDAPAMAGAAETMADSPYHADGLLRQQLQEQTRVARGLAEAFICPSPSIAGFEVATASAAAVEQELVGGDFLDFFPISGDRLGVVIGDVCGKGLVAAAYTAMARHTLRAYAMEDAQPACVLRRLNLSLCQQMHVDASFVTLVYGILDQRQSCFTYVNAGHPPPILTKPGACWVHPLETTGGLVGALEEMEYEEATVDLARGAFLALFTDGVTEARRGPMFLGEEGVAAVVQRHVVGTAREMADAILRKAQGFSGGQLRDDMAIAVVRRM